MIVAIDPGKTSGIALWAPSEPLNPVTLEAVERQKLYVFMRNLAYVNREVQDAVLLIEKFDIDANTHKKSAQHDALYIIGAMEYLSWEFGWQFRLSPRTKKAFATDAKLKHLGWYKPTKGGHANDAARHLLAYLTDSGHPDIIDALRSMT